MSGLFITGRFRFDVAPGFCPVGRLRQLSIARKGDATGSEDIAITPEQAHGTLNGVCSMGMKSFKILFDLMLWLPEMENLL